MARHDRTRLVSLELRPAVPILRVFGVPSAGRFYVDYLGCTVDSEDGDGDRPVYIQVSRGPGKPHLSSPTTTARRAAPC
jgi:hypothetical protein